MRCSSHEMRCVLTYDDRGWLRPDARLLMHRLALVIVKVCCGTKRIASGQGTRCILHGILTRELVLHVARHSSCRWPAPCWQSARHHGRSCLTWKRREAVARNLAAEAALDGLWALYNVAPVAAGLRHAS